MDADQTALVGMLEEALDRLGVTVRVETMPEESHISGGSCLVHGKREVILSPAAPVAERIEVLAGALRELDTGSMWLPPVVRRLIAGQESD
jgi:hypothetical protein